MLSKQARWVLSGLGLLVVGGFLVSYVSTRIHQKQVEGEILAALRERNLVSQLNAFKSIQESRGEEASRVAVRMLNDPDPSIRRGVVKAISMVDAPNDVVDMLATNLRTNADPYVRLSCAIRLMSVKTPPVDAAYLYALHDTYDKVVQIACVELGYRKVKGAKEALTATLNHPLWDVRLAACKALILSKSADGKTVETLEHMASEKEAIRYDAQIEEFDRMEKEAGVQHKEGKEWGKFGTILDQARKVAKNNAPD